MKKYPTIGPAYLLMVAATLSGCSAMSGLQSDAGFQNRFYAGAGALISEVEPDTDGVTGVSVDESRSSGGSLTLGYDLNNRFSVEGHLADLGEATLDPQGSVSYQVGGISGVFYGLGEASDRDSRTAFSLYGRLGVGGLNNDADGVRFKRVNSAHLLAGAGVEYGFDSGLAARAEIVAHEADAKYAQLGLIYRFGGQSSKGADNFDGANSAAVVADAELTSLSPLPDAPVAEEISEESQDRVTGTQPDTQPVPQPQIEMPAIIAVVDADNDGVADQDDSCGQTPVGLPVNSSGCEVFNGVVEGVNFRTGSATLTEDAIEVLNGVSRALLDYPDVRVTIEAHTDNEGDANDNLQLSKRRAIAVARYLVDQGVPGARLRPQAFGESEPRSTNNTAQGRAANRRVEFSIFE